MENYGHWDDVEMEGEGDSVKSEVIPFKNVWNRSSELLLCRIDPRITWNELLLNQIQKACLKTKTGDYFSPFVDQNQESLSFLVTYARVVSSKMIAHNSNDLSWKICA